MMLFTVTLIFYCIIALLLYLWYAIVGGMFFFYFDNVMTRYCNSGIMNVLSNTVVVSMVNVHYPLT